MSRYDVPKDESGRVLAVGDRVVSGRPSTSTREGTITFVYPDCAGVIDVRVRYDGYEEEEPKHGSCLRKLVPCPTCGKPGHLSMNHGGWDPRDEGYG